MGAKAMAKSVLNRLFRDYRINWIYASSATKRDIAATPQPLSPVQIDALLTSPTAKMRNAARFSQGGLDGFAMEVDGTPACVAHFADHARYDRNGTWVIGNNEIALMDIATEEAMRGRGLAVQMITAMTQHYITQGRDRVIAFIWWSNTPSVRAFDKAGWKRIGVSIEVAFGGRWRTVRLRLK
jgi:RimJ/RimL family protein N-acetyltransferase